MNGSVRKGTDISPSRLANWAGNYAYAAPRLHEPRTLEQLQGIVRRVSVAKALGSRHSFNDIADTPGDLISLARMPRSIAIDPVAATVTVDGALRYGELCEVAEAAGFALHNLASLPHISVAGACATATHGSGDRSGGLATAVSALEIVAADGELKALTRGPEPGEFEGSVVSLGALGVVTKVTLDLEPSFRMRQDVYEDLPLARLADHFDEVTSSAESVSLFTDWRGQRFGQVWLKRRVGKQDAFEPPSSLFGARPATEARHPIAGLSADACTPQLGVAGPWHERIPHFRMDHTPSSGAELQSEYFVPRRHAVEALLAVDRLRDRIAPLVQVSEVRTIAADNLWMSPAFGRPSVAIHFTWRPDWPSVRDVLPAIEDALRPFEPRPHWGKLFTIPAADLRPRYERLADFVDLVGKRDPAGKFRNGFLDHLIFDRS
jgi:xylitol oxidase